MKRLNIILIRYLFIFLFFAGLMLLFFAPVYRYVMDFTLNNELAHIGNRLEQGIASLDTIYADLDLIIVTHRQDSRFQVFKSLAINTLDELQNIYISHVTLWELRDSINLALLPYSLSVDAGLLFPNGAALTRRGIYYYPVSGLFYGPIFQCGDLNLEEWRGLLLSNRPFIPAMPYTSVYYASGEAITYSAHWAYMGFPEEIFFFATLPVDGIVTMLADADVAKAAYVRMYNAQGELLFSRGNDTGASFHVISSRGQANSLQYEIGVSDSYIAGRLQPVRNLIFLFACVTAFFVIVISFLFAWRSSLPERYFVERVYPDFNAQKNVTVFTGIRQIYRNIEDNIIGEKNRLLTAMKTIETQTALIRTQFIDRIRNALLSGDEDAAQIILRDCYTSLPKPEDPLMTGILADMLYAMLLDLGEELSALMPPETVPAFEPPEYIPGAQEEIFKVQYPDCFSKICESVRAHKEDNMPPMGRDVLAFINQRFCDPNLYSTMVADHFKISSRTIQNLVKQCTGQTFLYYIEKLRLEKARELLSSSHDNMTQIAHACGFSNITTFYRSFKRVYGYPPGRLQR